MPQEKPTPSLECYADQFILDLKSLPEEKIASLAKGLPDEDKLAPLECIIAHVKESPNRVPQLMSRVIEEMPYYPVIRHFRWINMDSMVRRFGAEISSELGELRMNLSILSLLNLDFGESNYKRNIPQSFNTKSLPVKDLPTSEKINQLEVTISAVLVSVDSLGKRDLSIALKDAQSRANKAEVELKNAQKRWDKQQRRSQDAQLRTKENAAQEAKTITEAESSRKYTSLKNDYDEEVIQRKKIESELIVLRNELVKIKNIGGITPDKIEEIKATLAKEAKETIEHEISEKVRPWLLKIIEAESSQPEVSRLNKVTTELIEKTKAAILEQDIILNWELNKERALNELQERLEELDKLMAKVLSPSADLIKAHTVLREEVIKCRQAIRPTEPLGTVTQAMMAGLRNASDQELPELTGAIEKLIDAKVVDAKEGDALRRFIQSEKTLRSDKKNLKKSPRQKLSNAIHKKQPVDLLVDVYNFMHADARHFAAFQKESTFNKGKISFGPEARVKIAKMFSRLHELNENCRVLLFLDGNNCENKKPFSGVKFILPTIKTHGDGQADEEIRHYYSHNCRKEAFVLVVTKDHAVQNTVDHHLTPNEFLRYLSEIGGFII